MKYTYNQGILKEPISKLTLFIAALFFGTIAATTAIAPAQADAPVLDTFTQAELDDNWVTDRQFPSGGVESVSFAGRNNVAKIGVTAEDQSTNGQFYYFEGIKKVGDFGTQVQVDLFVPSEWQSADVVNVGFWTSDDPITAYPLVVYRNTSTASPGFYVYDTTTGAYIDSGVVVNYDDWNTLSISLDTDNDEVDYMINGQPAGSSFAGSETIGQVFLNHYNDGVRDYDAYWHVGISNPTDKEQCKKGGYESFGFKNQGQCIKFVNTGRDSR